MAKIKTRIELSEKDILALVAKEYNLQMQGATICVYKYDGDAREPGYATITIEATQNANR